MGGLAKFVKSTSDKSRKVIEKTAVEALNPPPNSLLHKGHKEREPARGPTEGMIVNTVFIADDGGNGNDVNPADNIAVDETTPLE